MLKLMQILLLMPHVRKKKLRQKPLEEQKKRLIEKLEKKKKEELKKKLIEKLEKKLKEKHRKKHVIRPNRKD